MKEDHRSTVIYATFAFAKRKPENGAYITAMIFLHIILHSAVHIYHFIASLPKTEFTKTIESSAWWRTGLLKR